MLFKKCVCQANDWFVGGSKADCHTRDLGLCQTNGTDMTNPFLLCD